MSKKRKRRVKKVRPAPAKRAPKPTRRPTKRRAERKPAPRSRAKPAPPPPPASPAAPATRPPATARSAEEARLLEHRAGNADWKRWGPFVSERAWGTVREDYSHDGAAWHFLPHDHARSKAYRWGEDGLAGLCDQQQNLCVALALWNTKDPILKERLFGLSGPEGNHGEDVKELYYYLDATPTFSYLKYLYKYPQCEFPYWDLVSTNAKRGTHYPEYELIDTDVIDHFRACGYYDVFVEYAKEGPESIRMRVTAHNRGAAGGVLHVVPQLWFRNDWAWGEHRGGEPVIETISTSSQHATLRLEHPKIGQRHLYAHGNPRVLHTCNETNSRRLYGLAENPRPFVKDAFHDFIVCGKTDAVNPEPRGTKVGLQYVLELEAGKSKQVELLLTDTPMREPFAGSKKVFDMRGKEADEFYNTVHQPSLSQDEKRVQRQALAGMLWSLQYYSLDMKSWLSGDDPHKPPPPQHARGRNSDWPDLSVAAVMSMPDKWEYPWFAAWDWAFHLIPLGMVDIDLAKQQMELMLSEKLQHPNGQVPAYEWAFSDVNPPVQAYAVWRVYNMEKHAHAEHGDLDFLERSFHKLLLNFVWWVNRKDSKGRNVFQGGFLGLDNISVFDRSQPLPGGGMLEQADATGWMGLFCLNMMAIGLELAQHRRVYEHLGIKFFEHFMAISHAINTEISAGVQLWNEDDGWYYDVVHGLHGNPNSAEQLKVRSQVGLIPLFAAMVLEHSWFERLPAFKARYEWLLTNRPELCGGMACVWTPNGAKCLLSIVNFNRLQRILRRTLDEEEFLSPHGLRALSRYHLKNPYVIALGGREWTVRYEPGESSTHLFGGNSNWRGPIWFPTNFMLITALRVYDRFFGQEFKIECPTGSGNMMNLNQVALYLGQRLSSIFLPDPQGRRPVHGPADLFNTAHFRDHILFYEYFHGDSGAGLGASHQTGWTGLVAKLLDQQAAGRRHGTTA